MKQDDNDRHVQIVDKGTANAVSFLLGIAIALETHRVTHALIYDFTWQAWSSCTLLLSFTSIFQAA